MDRLQDNAIPVARTDGLLVEELGAETVVYDTETKQAHCLSPLAAAVFAQCDGVSTVTEVTERVADVRGEAVSEADVAVALAQLEERRLLVVPEGAGSSRREMLRKLATTGAAAAALPLITSIVAPTAALASGGCNVGAKCKSQLDCGTHYPSGGGSCTCGPNHNNSGQMVCSLVHH